MIIYNSAIIQSGKSRQLYREYRQIPQCVFVYYTGFAIISLTKICKIAE